VEEEERGREPEKREKKEKRVDAEDEIRAKALRSVSSKRSSAAAEEE
jgi:hypothetical protein